jgi:hypothetical protein
MIAVSRSQCTYGLAAALRITVMGMVLLPEPRGDSQRHKEEARKRSGTFDSVSAVLDLVQPLVSGLLQLSRTRNNTGHDLGSSEHLNVSQK